MTYQVNFTPRHGQEAIVTDFAAAEAALAHADRYLSEPYYMLRIHDTATGHWLSYAQFNRLVKAGDAFGPLVPQSDGSVL